MTFRDSFGYVLAVLMALAIFGWRYNAFVAEQERKSHTEGFLSLFVAAGVGGTLIGVFFLDLLLDWNAAFVSILAFAATGSPMIYGSITRYIQQRDQLREALRGDKG